MNAALARTFSGLANYVATTLRLSSPPEVFARLRLRMAAEVISFDALRSYIIFEMPEARANEQQIQRIIREFLLVLSIGRGLFVRLDAFDTEAASSPSSTANPRSRDDRIVPPPRREASLLAVRAALAMVLLSSVWLATGWAQGFTVVSGGAIMLFFGVNQDHPLTAARSYLVWSTIGTIAGYAVMIFVMPQLQGFPALAAVLLLVLLPAGLMVGTPSHALAGIALGGFTIAQISTGNTFVPDELSYINNAAALVLGMLICLAVVAAMPVTSHAQRKQSWQHAIGTVLPAVARGDVLARKGSGAIVDMIAALLPRLTLDCKRDEAFFRGTLGAASSAIELGRLLELKSDPAMPRDVAQALERFLERFASALEYLTRSRTDHKERFGEAEASIAEIHAVLLAHALRPGDAARLILQAGASLRFIADRFDIDRAYLEYGFGKD